MLFVYSVAIVYCALYAQEIGWQRILRFLTYIFIAYVLAVIVDPRIFQVGVPILVVLFVARTMMEAAMPAVS